MCLTRTFTAMGIRLNNFLGLSKFLILLFLIGIRFATVAVLAEREQGLINDLSPAEAFRNEEPNRRPFRYAEAFLFVLFPFGGFHQANYVSITEVCLRIILTHT